MCWVYAYAAVTGLQAMSGKFVALGKAPVEISPPDDAASQDPDPPNLITAGTAAAPVAQPVSTPVAGPPRPQPRPPSFLGQRSGGWLKR